MENKGIIDDKLLEQIYPIGTIYFSFIDKQPPFFEWERWGFNPYMNCYMFKRIR